MRLCSRLCTRQAENILEFLPSVFNRNQNSVHAQIHSYRTVANILEMKKNMSVTDWVKLKNLCSVPGSSYQAFHALMARNPGLSEVKKLFAALEETKAMNPVLKTQMLPAFELYALDCTEEDQKFVLDTYDEVLTKFPVLTRELVEGLLRGLTPTLFWKEKGKHLLSKLDTVPSTTLLVFATVAFANKDYKFGWELINEAVPGTVNLSARLYIEILKCHEHHPEENLLFKLLDLVEDHSFMLTVSAAKYISDILVKSENWVSRLSTVDPSGQCSCCQRTLKKVPLTNEEHKILLEQVESRFDLNCRFSSYEKREVEEFKEYLKRCPSYSVVIDGPNFFYRVEEESRVRGVVKSLEEQGHKILVICKEHLRKEQSFLSALKGHTIYYVKNRTKDDTFTIYAALSSSRDTFVISHDFYGTYYSELKGDIRILFRKWQMSNQVIGTGYLATNLVFPKFSPICQKTEDGSLFHVPLVPDHSLRAFAPCGWLCMQQVSKKQKQNAEKLWPVKELVLDDLGVDAFKGHYQQLKKNLKVSKRKESSDNIRKMEKSSENIDQYFSSSPNKPNKYVSKSSRKQNFNG